MVLHIIRADILLIARIFPRPFGARKNTTQLAKYPRVLYAKPSIKIYVFFRGGGGGLISGGLLTALSQINKPFTVVSALQSVWFIYT